MRKGVAREPRAAARARYDGLLYARGYLVGQLSSPSLPPGWERRAFGDWTIWHDPRLPVAEAAAPRRLFGPKGETALACLGVILDASRPEVGPDEVLAQLASALARSEDAMLGAMDTMGGRFVLLYRTGGRTHLVTDAAGTKQAFRYARETALVSSHARLVALNAQDAPGEDLVTFRGGYPGLGTPWRNIRLLTPNTRLRLEDMEVRRFWPRRRLEPIGVARAADGVAGLMRGTLRHLAERHDVHLSVTAGLDSRVSLAVAKDLPVSLFTFRRDDGDEDNALDLAFSEAISTDLGHAVRILRLGEGPPAPAAFNRIVKQNAIARHNLKLAWAFHAGFPQTGGTIHARSNLSEVGRQFYGRSPWAERPQPRHLARLHLRFNVAMRVREFFSILDHYDAFAAVTGILDCGDMVDLRSLFYWEHRMAAWFGNAAAESDAGIDTISPFNCRRIFELMLSVDEAQQRTSAIHRRIVAEHAPELTAYPVNGERLWGEPTPA